MLGCPFEVRLLPCEKNARKAALRGVLTKEDELQEQQFCAGSIGILDHTKTAAARMALSQRKPSWKALQQY